ncbi:hypothetical protein [Microbacterium arborescens]
MVDIPNLLAGVILGALVTWVIERVRARRTADREWTDLARELEHSAATSDVASGEWELTLRRYRIDSLRLVLPRRDFRQLDDLTSAYSEAQALRESAEALRNLDRARISFMSFARMRSRDQFDRDERRRDAAWAREHPIQALRRLARRKRKS